MRLLGQKKQTEQAQPAVGQAQVPFSQETADRYNANPEQFVGANAIDPKYFGYPADSTARAPMLRDGYTPNAQYEDEGFMGDPSNFNQFSPQNADVANYRQNAPFGNYPEQNVYNNITPYDSDAVMPGRMLQGAGQRRVNGMDANTQELLRRINSRNLRVQ